MDLLPLQVNTKRNTCLSLFKRDLARARHGVEESILVVDNSSAIRAASSNMWFRGKAIKQSKIALRRNFITSVCREWSPVLPKSKNKSLLIKPRFCTIEFGNTSKLRIFSFQLELFVQILKGEKKDQFI